MAQAALPCCRCPAARPATDADLRERLGEFRALLVISLLMTESVSEDQILELAASSRAGARHVADRGLRLHRRPVALRPGPRRDRARRPGRAAGRARQQRAARSSLPGRGWAWAYPLRGVGGLLGHLVASCAAEPSAEERFLIQVMAQQTGVAVSNARLHARERATAAELAATNAALAETVTSLQRSMDIHERLTRVAVSGRGPAGHRQGAARAHRDAGRDRGPVRQPDRLGAARASPTRTRRSRSPSASTCSAG